MSQHRRYRAVDKLEFHEHAMRCKQCHEAALVMADEARTPAMDDAAAIRMVVRLCCVKGAVILLQWMRQGDPERYAAVEK